MFSAIVIIFRFPGYIMELSPPCTDLVEADSATRIHPGVCQIDQSEKKINQPQPRPR